jgi:hypothetical protein
MMRALRTLPRCLGLHARVVGDKITPLIEPGGLLIVSAGRVAFSMALAVLGVAWGVRVRVMVATAKPISST